MSKQLTPLEVLGKIDHTICMNFNDKNIKWNIDNKNDQTLYKNGEGYDPIDTDCKSFEDFAKCYEIIEKALKDSEMEHTLRVRLENINYKLVREKQASEKKLKALEIIKKKKIDWSHFYRLLLDKRFDEKSDIQKVKILNKYNEYGKKITIKEFDLLKEVLK